MWGFVNGPTDGSVFSTVSKQNQGLNGPPHVLTTLWPQLRVRAAQEGLRFGALKPQRPSLSFCFIFALFYSEMRHWINYVDYEGPPCSPGIIKKGYPSGELRNNLACKCVSVSGHRSWPSVARLRRGREESGGEPVSFPPWWMSLLAVQC